MAVEIDELALRAAFSQPDDDGTFQGEYAAYLADIAKRRTVVLLPFAPKAAGTFLRTAVIAATGGQLVRAVHAQGGREAQLYLPIFIHYYYGGVCEEPMVVHVHMQAHPANCRFIEVLSLKPVVMVRSITDMLASMWDMFLADPAMRIETVNCMVPDAFADFSAGEKADFMFDMFAPWYVSYYASWLDYAATHSDTVLVTHYDDLAADPVTLLGRILDHVGLPRPPE
ncbi:MAG: sulfotransferase domain-containing protein, partial [Rhizomicrobium sp.]